MNVYLSIIASVLLGAMCAFVIYYFYKIKDSSMRQEMNDLDVELLNGEEVLVEGMATKISGDKGMGKLTLTKKQLIYTSANQELLCYLLKDISVIRLYKKWGIFDKGIAFNYDGSDEYYHIDYPGDWKSIIKYIQQYQ